MVPYWLLYKALLIQIIVRVIPTQKQLLFKHLFCNECFYIQSILWKIYKNIELHFIQFTVDFGKLGFRGTRFLCSALVTLSWNNRNWPPQLHLDRSSFPPVWLLLPPLMCSSCYSLRALCLVFKPLSFLCSLSDHFSLWWVLSCVLPVFPVFPVFPVVPASPAFLAFLS